MKKSNIEYSGLIKGLSYILFGFLLVVFFPVLKDSLSSALRGEELSSLIRTEITSIILAFSTIILVIITAFYAKSTKEMLDEQIKM